MLDQISLAATKSTMSPIALFLQADWVVKAVMIGLIIASIYVWAVIIGHGRSTAKIMKACDQFERDFRKAGNIDGFYQEHAKSPLPSARIFAAGMNEWRH